MPLGKKTTTRSRSGAQEKAIAKDLSGRVTSNSGATFHQNDVTAPDLEVEAKTTTAKSYAISISEFKAIESKSLSGKIPVQIVQFESHNKRSLAIVSYEDFLELIKAHRQIHKT